MDNHHHHDNMHVETYLEMKNLQPRYLCPYGCNKLIASRTVDYHKNNGCGRRLTDSITSHPELKKRCYCCGACYNEFVTRSEFHAHLRVEHDVHPEVRNMTFPDRQAFDRFKKWLEAEGGAHFRHKSGAKRRNRGKGIFLACNRSGNVSNEKSCPVDRTGPFRLGFTCTAYIHATEHLDGHVSAEVCGDHYGHDARMRLPNAIKYVIAEKQMNHVSSIEIIGFLRSHFLPIAQDNIYAQRVCFVDVDELKAIFMSSTRKWAKDGIPQAMELWEEELLEKAGIVWPPSRSPRTIYSKPTTSDIAIQEGWLRPRVFVAKTRREDGVMVSYEDPTAEGAPVVEYEQEMDPRYIEMEYDEDGYGQEEQMIVEEDDEDPDVVHDQNDYVHQQMIKEDQIMLVTGGKPSLDNEQIGVDVGNEVVVEDVDEAGNHSGMIEQKIQQGQIEEHVVLESPTNEIVIVDGEEEVVNINYQHHHMQPHQHLHHHIPIAPLQHQHQHQHHLPQQQEQQQGHHELADQADSSNLVDQRYIEVSKADTLEQIMDEMEQFKETLLKRANNMTPSNLKSVQIRLQSLHQSIMEKETNPQQTSITVFPNRSKSMYRPGRNLEQREQDYLVPRGDVTLQPIEDDLSDDEGMMGDVRRRLNWNASIWN